MAIEQNPAGPRRHRRFNWHLRPHPFANLSNEMDEFFSHYSEPSIDMDSDALAVSLDTAETEDAYEINLDVPGVKKKDIDISFENGRLTISGNRKREEEEKGKFFHRTERSFGSFQTSFALPGEVDEAKIDAQLTDGVLTLTIPKSEKAKNNTRKIAIKAS